VRNNNTEHIEGIVTLEDVFEELIQENIVDEEEFAKRKKGMVSLDGLRQSSFRATNAVALQDSKGMVEIPLQIVEHK
jgi:CBS domain containing-hemolysin-like protein